MLAHDARQSCSYPADMQMRPGVALPQHQDMHSSSSRSARMSRACKLCMRLLGLHDNGCGCDGRAAPPPRGDTLQGPRLQAGRQVRALRVRLLVQLQRLAPRVQVSRVVPGRAQDLAGCEHVY